MPLLHPSTVFTRLTLTPISRISTLSRQFSTNNRVLAASGYGDPNGNDPKSSSPESQGASNSTKHAAEHPGPPPPAEGNNSGGATKAFSGKGKNPEDASAQSGGSRSKDAKETGSSPTAGSIGGKRSFSTSSILREAEKKDGKEKEVGGAKPKITDAKESGNGLDMEKAAEVEQHNKEFEKGHDRAPKAEDDKVDEKFWQGKWCASILAC